MDNGDEGLDPITPLVFLSFLQHQSGRNEELTSELDALARQLKLTTDINCNGVDGDAEEDGELQTDGHLCYNPRDHVRDLQPAWPADEDVLRNVAAGLIEIADQLENRMVAQAAENLINKLQGSPLQHWQTHLSAEVDRMLKAGLDPWLEQLPHERVVLVLTMTLVKRACEHMPRLLQGLFSSALQCMATLTAR
ncbi:BH3 interacting domain death agonist isoform X1 [Megalops cyprinoides]|uniref:BH3 interacting domain death agonist isoform X1 n=1 Tax=Megalops cyprinoides TaxID=118141 RepID=UPI0018647FDB|nr:BH3 interacting domain death agonist isoform X1 [Megalops cyprinoides]XP_036373901.1 BH3 interacting domain death agonist isoform X1 [Megalops cyprinoides]